MMNPKLSEPRTHPAPTQEPNPTERVQVAQLVRVCTSFLASIHKSRAQNKARNSVEPRY